MSIKHLVGVLGAVVLLAGSYAFGASTHDFSNLKKEVEELRQRLATQRTDKVTSGPIGRADAVVANKYGPNAQVTTRDGKLTIGGLLQVWNYNIQNDNKNYNARIRAPFPAASPVRTRFGITNEINDNDSYRIRRAEIKFSLDITEDITAVIIVDPTGGDEANTFPSIPTNQGVVGQTVAGTPTIDVVDPAVAAGIIASDFGAVARTRFQNGTVRPNRMLQDAYINYHTPHIPHHDFTVGQFKPPIGEEGNRNSGQLDFVERAMINQFSNQRDLGIMVHGWWFGENPSTAMLHYWIGGFDTAGSFHNTFASFQNRSDDNDAFDIAWKIRLRPLWKNDTWGSLELGFSRQDGVHGEAGKGLSFTGTAVVPRVDGLSLQETHAYRQWAWAWYRLGRETPVAGWWLRGEWGSLKDRALPGVGSFVSVQLRPKAFKREGWYFGTGYRLSKSIWSEALKTGGMIHKLLHKFEFTFRYETFGNIIADDVVNANETDVYKTSVYTAGINIYWKGYNVRSQLNYMWVDEPNRDHIPVHIREVNNNIFIVNTQVRW